MAATKLTVATARHATRAHPRGELRRAWLGAYTATWVLTLAPAALLTIAPAKVQDLARGVLGATLRAQNNPPPSIGHVLLLLAHNFPVAAWPLLLGALDVGRRYPARQLTDILVAAWLTVNIVPVGAALDLYGATLLPFIPQVPFEWAALALGTSSWLAQRRRPLQHKEMALLLALILGALVCAATLETLAVPHQ